MSWSVIVIAKVTFGFKIRGGSVWDAYPKIIMGKGSPNPKMHIKSTKFTIKLPK